MQINLKTNIDQVTKNLDKYSKKKLPNIIAGAINNTAYGLRNHYQQQAIKRFNNVTGYTLSGFMVEQARYREPAATVYIHPSRYWMELLVEGGIRRPQKKYIRVPHLPNARDEGVLTPEGSLRRRINLLAKSRNTFVGTVKGIHGVWARRKNFRKGLKLLVALKRQVPYKPYFPFYRIGETFVKRTFKAYFNKAMTYEKRFQR